RLVSNWCLTNDLYILDLESHNWTKVQDFSLDAPEPRYFHSANTYLNLIYVFGGIGLSKSPDNQHCVLDDIAIFDLQLNKWRKVLLSPSLYIPKPRYAHLSVVNMHYLMIIGGQDLENNYIEEINYFDMNTSTWTYTCLFHKHCGLYRSIALCQPETFPECALDLEKSIFVPENPSSSQLSPFPSRRKSMSVSESNSRLSSYGETSTSPYNSHYRKSVDITQKSDLEFISLYNQHTTDNPVYIYSNYNFRNVKNELYVITFSEDNHCNITDISDKLSDELKPPGLRLIAFGALI
ncbi:hypothetical protein PCK2_000435, partial [Pneumocystis canis]